MIFETNFPQVIFQCSKLKFFFLVKAIIHDSARARLRRKLWSQDFCSCGIFPPRENAGPECSRTIGVILSLQLISAWFDFQFMSAPHRTFTNHPASGCIHLNFLTQRNLDVLWRLWGQERNNEKRGRKLEIDTRVRVEKDF